MFGPGAVCELAVTLTPQAGARATFSELPNGREGIRFDADTLVTNDAAGTGLLVRERDTTIVSELAPGEERFTTTGTGIVDPFAGDQGPNGAVGDPFAVTGRVQQTLEFDMDDEDDPDRLTAFTLRGPAIDLCAVLAD